MGGEFFWYFNRIFFTYVSSVFCNMQFQDSILCLPSPPLPSPPLPSFPPPLLSFLPQYCKYSCKLQALRFLEPPDVVCALSYIAAHFNSGQQMITIFINLSSVSTFLPPPAFFFRSTSCHNVLFTSASSTVLWKE